MSSRKLRNLFVRFLAVTCFLFLIGSAVHAQSSTTGAIGVIVIDPQAKSVVGAEVVARLASINFNSPKMLTDSSGRALIPNLAPGIYELGVTAPNFAAFKTNEIIVEVGRVTSVEVSLGLAGQAISTTVTAEAPVINAERSEFSTNINMNSVTNLPINGRRWSSYVLATPAAVLDGTFGLISFRGISGLLNNSTVDGADNNQAFFAEEKGRTRLPYSTSQQSIQEFQVNTSTYSAEFGRSAGGVVNAITKSGTNNYHGTLFFLDRDNAIGAAFNPFARASVLVGGVFTSVPIKPVDTRYQYGGDVGGYIFKDKLFWYFSFDGQNRNFPLTSIPTSPAVFFGGITVAAPPPPPVGTNQCGLNANAVGPGGVPWNSGSTEGQQLFCRGITQGQSDAALTFVQSLTGVVPRTGNQTIYFPKLDWKVNHSNTLTFQFNRLRWNSLEGIQTGPTVANGIDSIGSDYVKADTSITTLTTLFSPTVSNQLRFMYGRDFEFEFSDPPIAGEPVSSQGKSPAVSIGGSASFSFGKPTFLDRRAFPDEHHYQWSDTLSISKGKHFLRFGADVNRVNDVNDNLFQEGGSYSYPSRVNFITDHAASLNALNGGKLCGTLTAGVATSTFPCYTSFNQGFGPTKFIFTTWDYAFFIQDDWRVSSRFTLNMGIRWEWEKMPSPQLPNNSILLTGKFPNNLDNYGPRLGFAWDLTGRGKTVIRAGSGVYYGRIINSTISNAITNTANPLAQLSLQLLPAAAGAPIYPNVLSAAAGSASVSDAVMFDAGAHNPRVYEYDAVFEHEIMTNTVISVSYIGSAGHDLPIFTDRNLPAPSSRLWSIIGGPLNGQTFTLPVYLGSRPNTSFGRFTTILTNVVSHYNAMAVQFNRRMTKGLQFQMSYTLAKSTDSGQSSQTFTSANNVLDPNNPGLNVGPTNFDIRHRFVASAVWQPQYWDKSSPFVRALLSNWTLAPVVYFQTGVPLSPSVSGNFPSGATSTGLLGAGGVNRAPFDLRNSARLPRTSNVDLRLARTFNFGERMHVDLFAETFNLFNHVNYTAATTTHYTTGGTNAAPTLTFNSTTFLALTNANNGTLGPTQRLFQFGGRFYF
jgi:hypothetical protein